MTNTIVGWGQSRRRENRWECGIRGMVSEAAYDYVGHTEQGGEGIS